MTRQAHETCGGVKQVQCDLNHPPMSGQRKNFKENKSSKQKNFKNKKKSNRNSPKKNQTEIHPKKIKQKFPQS